MMINSRTYCEAAFTPPAHTDAVMKREALSRASKD
jgi:hypothetical protein